MKIKELHIKSFQVIKDALFSDMGSTVVIAGPNGVGKTTVKNAIIHTFQNGQPPLNCKIVLEATNDEERNHLGGADDITLPNQGFWKNMLAKNRRKVSAKTRLIHINSERLIQNVNFQQYGLNQLGDPEAEETSYNYSHNNVNDRFQDVLNTLYRMKTKLVTTYGLAVVNEFESAEKVKTEVQKTQDPTEPFIHLFNQLLHPKKMAPIKPESKSINFFDEEGNERNFLQLSSGEKEVVAITFDIQLQNPEDCIILIDEPELHLHPELSFRLLKGLNSIGKNNQFFLFTHSADVISSSFDSGVWFIRPTSRTAGENQVKRVDRNTLSEINDVPNIREAVGMLSLGKKLLFVEGKDISIDRTVFSALALSSKKDVAIIPSTNCRVIEQLSHFSEVLSKGLLGLELRMVRDRDGLTEDKIKELTLKSGGRLHILPFYHIENIFLDPDALLAVSEQVLSPSKRKTREQIIEQLLVLAKAQVNFCSVNYVKQEIFFESPSLELTPSLDLSQSTIQNIQQSMGLKRDQILQGISKKYDDKYIGERLSYWNERLTKSIENGWSDQARQIFYGKRLLAEINNYITGSKTVCLWEHIVYSNDPRCVNALKELKEILDSI